MIPGINPRDLKSAMKKMGVTQEDIPAQKVVIHNGNKLLVITNPSVAKVKMMGEESYQITGDAEWIDAPIEITEGDIETVQESAECTREEAEQALKETNGDLASAILKIKKEE